MRSKMNNNSMLSGCRVIDLTDEKGWFCTKLLVDMGAEVLRMDRSDHFSENVYANTGKHCLSLNIENEQGREILLKLMKLSDVVVESRGPGYLQSLGNDFQELRKTNPPLILASITPFGQAGPSAHKKSSELTASASGGYLYLNGESVRPPLKPYGPQAFQTACLFAANGILMALRRRRLSGRGQQIEISVQECLAGTLDHALVRFFGQGDIARRQGTLYWNNSFRIFSCRDGFVATSFLQNWETLVEWLDSEDMAGDLKDLRWQNFGEREKNVKHIVAIIEKWTLTHSADELVELGQLMHLPWAKVAKPEEILNNPHLKERGYFVEKTDYATGKSYSFPGAPVKMSGSSWQVNTNQPVSDDSNQQIYGNLLGLSSSEIEKLKSEGVIKKY
jgi:crotonobetainyl-CoA:carnitine CoA-transferase CaiB-like acyl-CoA transferase